jgi:hypothetical protein
MALVHLTRVRTRTTIKFPTRMLLEDLLIYVEGH